MPNITMQKVADTAGVSMKTVSRVVNKESGVNKETRRKVLEVIEQLDYRPNPAARGLAASRSFLVALLYANPSTSYITSLQNGVLSACRKHDYGLLIHPCSNDDDRIVEKIISMARQSRVDGLVLTPPLSDREDVLEMLDERNLKYVRISPLEHNDRSPIVYADEFDAAYLMTTHLISQGHTRIGFITGLLGRSGTEMRLKGFKQAMDDNHLDIDQELIVQGKYTYESGEMAARKLLQMKNRPTAIFASNDYMAAGAMKVAHQMKIRVPYDLSVSGYDDSPLAHHIWPRLTTISHPVEQLANQATLMLIQHLKNQPTAFVPDSIQSKLVIRDSTGPIVD